MKIRSLSIWWIGLAALAMTVLPLAVWWVRLQRATREAQIDNHLMQARQAAAQSRWSVAADELHGLLSLTPDSDGAWLLLADVEFRRGHLDEALRCVARVPSESPNGALARQLEGTLLLTAGQGSRAEAVLKECLRLDPRSIEARRRLVFLYAVELRRDELTQLLGELNDMHAARMPDLVLLSVSAFVVWNATEILEWIDKFVASDPLDVPARIAAGRYRLRKNDLDGAQAILQEACSLEPTNRHALAGLIECLIDRNDLDDVRRRLECLPNDWRGDVRFAYFQGRVAEESARWDEARAFYRRATHADPDHRESHYRLGQILVQAGQAADAAPYLDRAQKLADRESLLGALVNSAEPGIYAPQVARLEAELGHDRIAGLWYDEAVRLNPGDEALRAEAELFSQRIRTGAKIRQASE